MSKCPVCNSRKGKRVCLLHDTPVCSNCCGDIREATQCRACVHYRDPSAFRKYHEIPAFIPADMDGNSDLTRYSDVIEGSINTFDLEYGGVDDALAMKVLERMYDKYYFKDGAILFESQRLVDLFAYVDAIIAADLPNADPEVFVKVLGAVYHSVRRRTRGGREYMNVIAEYVGRRLDSGLYARPMPTGIGQSDTNQLVIGH